MLKVWDISDTSRESEPYSSQKSEQAIATFSGNRDFWVCAVAKDGIIVAGDKKGWIYMLRLAGEIGSV
jgi:hypothetical protein